jgi:tRNA U34 5-methylaminomethyl-2-thiouridine-forming methyltransferase MnmC
MTPRTLLTTSDGSSTLHHSLLDETYHSRHGAIQESDHVFIKYGLEYYTKNTHPSLDILEVGLGTALNALLTLIRKPENQYVNYTSLEPFPIEHTDAITLNYPLKLNISKEQFMQFHICPFDKIVDISSSFTFQKMQLELQKYNTTKKYDIIYYDAFGPRAQSNMWKKDCFTKAYSLLKPNGILVTFCAKGSVKRTLKDCGFEVEPLLGPPGKREMTRAIKND